MRRLAPASTMVCAALFASLFVGFATNQSLRAREADEVTRSGLRTELVRTSELDTMVLHARSLAYSWGEAAEQLTATPSFTPAIGYMSSAFSKSRWHPILNRARPHEGIDIAAPMGTRVMAAASGRVQRVGYFGQFGLMIEIFHGNGYVTRYAHLRRAHVRAGQRVIRATQIGEVGESGLAIGPHLHYEVLLNGVARNPARYIIGDAAVQ